MSASTSWWDNCRKWYHGLPSAAQKGIIVGVIVIGAVVTRAIASSWSSRSPVPPPYPRLHGNGGFAPGPAYGTGGLPVVPGLPGPNGDGSYGPFITIRRAMEVVEIFQGMGYRNTIQYHNGDGQYVFPRR